MKWEEISEKLSIEQENFSKSYKCLNKTAKVKQETLIKHLQILFEALEAIRSTINKYKDQFSPEHKQSCIDIFWQKRDKLVKILAHYDLESTIPHDTDTAIIYNIDTSNTSKPEVENPTSIMSEFNLETATKAIPSFSGNYKELEAFLKIVEIIYNGLTQTGKTALIDYIVYVKLTQTVRTNITSVHTPNTFQELKDSLCYKYKSTTTIPQVQNQLTNLYQRNQNVTAFRNKILSLISELNQLQIAQLGTTATIEQKSLITQLNEQYSLSVFKNGINEQYKQTIFAALPKTFEAAVDLALELEQNNQGSNTKVMFILNNRRNNFNNNNHMRNNNNFRNNHNNFSHNFRPTNNSNNFRPNNSNNFRPTNNFNNFRPNNSNNSRPTNNFNNFRQTNNSNSQNSRPINNNNRYRNNTNTNRNSQYNRNSRQINVVNHQGNVGDPEVNN